jgi:hypothetical protein
LKRFEPKMTPTPTSPAPQNRADDADEISGAPAPQRGQQTEQPGRKAELDPEAAQTPDHDLAGAEGRSQGQEEGTNRGRSRHLSDPPPPPSCRPEPRRNGAAWYAVTVNQNHSMTINRTQAIVIVFFLLAWLSLLGILLTVPDVLDATLRLPQGDHRPAELAFLLALSAFLTLLAVGVFRRWRWTFWLVLVAFLASLLRGRRQLSHSRDSCPRTGRLGTCSYRRPSDWCSSQSGSPCWSAYGRRGPGEPSDWTPGAVTRQWRPRPLRSIVGHCRQHAGLCSRGKEIDE